MESSKPEFEKYLLVCVNERPDGERVACGSSFCGKELAKAFKDSVKKAGQADRIRVSKTYCLDVCEQGANVLLYPDNIWFKQVSLEDVPAILEKIGIKP
jgi:(2Fe-2S) ferredoxin